MKPNDIYDRVGTLLHDSGNVRWPKTELRMWLNDGQKALCTIRPDAHVESVEVELEEGSIQQVPAEAIKLIDITHNVVIGDGDVHRASRAITITDREEMDRFDSAWRIGRKSKTVQQFMHDATYPKVFYIYPPNDGTGLVSADVATMPPDVLASGTPGDGDVMELGDQYFDALVYYVMAKAYAKDGEFVSRSGEFMQLFVASLTGEQASVRAYQPNVTKAGGKPDVLAQEKGGV